MFDSIATLAVASSMRELYRLVLVDTPLAPYFSESLSAGARAAPAGPRCGARRRGTGAARPAFHCCAESVAPAAGKSWRPNKPRGRGGHVVRPLQTVCLLRRRGGGRACGRADARAAAPQRTWTR